jgi:hypothetical protein
MIIPRQFGFNCPSGLREEEFWNIFPIGSNKMAATAGLNLTLEPMGKVSQNASSLKSLGQLKPNCPGMVIGRSSTKFEHFPIGFNVNLCPAVVAILDFGST